MSIYLSPQRVIDLARVGTPAADYTDAHEELVDFLDEILLSPDVTIRTSDDATDVLDTVIVGLNVIASEPDDIEEELTEAIGPYLAEPLDQMTSRARAASPAAPNAVETYLRDQLHNLIDTINIMAS